MKKKTTLIDLLDAEFNRDNCLLGMALDIENGDFEYAMCAQFDYLYWCDVVEQLYVKHYAEWWALRSIAMGRPT